MGWARVKVGLRVLSVSRYSKPAPKAFCAQKVVWVSVASRFAELKPAHCLADIGYENNPQKFEFVG